MKNKYFFLFLFSLTFINFTSAIVYNGFYENFKDVSITPEYTFTPNPDEYSFINGIPVNITTANNLYISHCIGTGSYCSWIIKNETEYLTLYSTNTGGFSGDDGFCYNFTTPLKINSSSTMIFNYTRLDTGVSTGGYFYFNMLNNSIPFYLSVQSQFYDGNNDLPFSNNPLNKCVLSNISGTPFTYSSSVFMEHTVNMTKFYSNCLQESDLSKEYYINQFCINSMGQYNSDAKFNKIEISNNEINQFPTYNFSINNILCINDTEQQDYNIPITLNVNDNENDTIYYGTSATNTVNVTDKTGFTITSCFLGFCNIAFNEESLNNFVYPYSNTCLITSQPNISNFFFYNGYDRFNNEVYFLHLRNACDRTDKSIYYKTTYGTNQFLTTIDLYTLSNNNSFNVTLYNSNMEKLVILGFELNNTGVTIFNYNDTKNYVSSLNGITFSKGFILNVGGFNNDKFGIQIVNGTNAKSLLLIDNLPKFNNDVSDLMAFVSLTISDNSYTDISLKQIKVTYVNTIPVFTTEKPTNYTIFIDSTGKKFLRLFITDYPHLINNEYETVFQELNVYKASLCPNVVITPISDKLEDYQNTYGLTGIALTMNKLLWLVQFPYRFALYFGFAELMQYAVSLALIVSLIYLYTGNIGAISLNNLIVIAFMESLALNIMKLILPVIFYTFALLFAVVAYNSIFNHNTTTGG